ncbi:MAG: AsmA family protein [Acidobacteriaceae bacterium]|nr:AsmA family protein [Acidobacteriaceae bacterium]
MTYRSKKFLRRLFRVTFLVAVTVIIASLVAPFIDAAAFRTRIQNALETSLGRRVKFSQAHFSVLPGPGFSLTDVTISEDPRYGIEPFGHVATLQARVRIDKLLLGRIVFSSLRLREPSLNLVRRADGNWNIVELVNRLSRPSRLPVNFFPALQVADGRIDFKFGSRKTTLYITDTDLSIYPEKSGKLYIQFSGSPARTDRAGNGFGHLHGAANWYLRPATQASNQLEADVTLEPSNLSELTTLFRGEDAGVHGTLTSHAKIEGPLAALRLSGDLRLADVHRWDLMPSSGKDWRVRYSGAVDVVHHRLSLETMPSRSGEPLPVSLHVSADNFLTVSEWTILANIDNVPAQDLLPFAKRMGLVLPDNLRIQGAVDGKISYSTAASFSGQVSFRDLVASLPDTPSLHAALVSATLLPDRIHFDPATIETPGTGTLEATGDYNLSDHHSVLSVTASEFPTDALKTTFSAWAGVQAPFAILEGGEITGQLSYSRLTTDPPSCSGQLRFNGATLALPLLSAPLSDAHGRIEFDDSSFDINRLSAFFRKNIVNATYHYLAGKPERVHIDLPSADLTEIQSGLEPALRPHGLLARLGVRPRTIPPWLAERNLQGDISIGQLSMNGVNLGSLRSRIVWRGPNIEFSWFQLQLAEGVVQANGTMDVGSNYPRLRFTASVTGFPWRGGTLSAEGKFQTIATAGDALQRLRGEGTFSGQDLSLSAEDLFDSASGSFQLSFASGWPDLRLSDIQASQGDDAWTGVASTQSDGKLVIDLQGDGGERRVVSTLQPQVPAVSSAVELHDSQNEKPEPLSALH